MPSPVGTGEGPVMKPVTPTTTRTARPLPGTTVHGAPRLPRTYVPRRRLWRALDGAADSSVTLLVAPGGAGKTLGVVGWAQAVEAGKRPSDALWIQADRSWSPERLERLLDRADAEPADPAGTTGNAPRLVVIDDAHQLSAASLRVIDDRLNFAPQTVKLLLLSRWDLALSRLVPELLGHFTIVRGDLLRMDDAECAELIAAHARTTAPEVTAAIASLAQGWCAAIVLTARAVASAPDPVEAARRYTQGDARVADRIASEVFAALRPRERHLLLCTANEEVVTSEIAAHLSHDPCAGEILTDLETAGLLVTRLGAEPAPSRPPDAPDRYRIHPLLAEVVRRRIVAGGVDVERAQGTVRRAVDLDVARGATSSAFGRLVGVNLPEAAAALLAVDGLSVLMRGEGSAVQAFARHYPQVADAHPETWFFLARERWINNDVDAASHWMGRLLQHSSANLGSEGPDPTQVACVRLMRARLGMESMTQAVADAQSIVDAESVGAAPRVALPHLLGELGVTQTWLGQLADAEANLANAIRLGTAWNLPALAVAGMSHLATVFYLRGREDAARQLAGDALGLIEQGVPWHSDFAAHRGQLVVQLTTLSGLPVPTSVDDLPTARGAVHAADLTMRFWLRMRDARVALLRGAVMEAERILQNPFDVPWLPEHLRALVLIERGFLAALADDRQALAELTDELARLEGVGEPSLLRGLQADLIGDRRAAVDEFAHAAATARLSQPPCRALALTCLAQLRDALGESSAALEALQTAVTITEVRRNAVPFLGWSRQGTSVHVLLDRLHRQLPEPWLAELLTATGGHPRVTAVLAPWTPTVRERSTAPNPVVLPVLTPRERDVLHELARGSTYADIAGNLFLSENTVKTHVSSLYGKLAVSRRSEALAVARSMSLL
jgi:LuxR family maltose regulon positive regulatory protein